jgi:hypothetical protein
MAVGLCQVHRRQCQQNTVLVCQLHQSCSMYHGQTLWLLRCAAPAVTSWRCVLLLQVPGAASLAAVQGSVYIKYNSASAVSVGTACCYASHWRCSPAKYRSLGSTYSAQTSRHTCALVRHCCGCGA